MDERVSSIPDVIDGYPVRQIGENAFADYTYLHSIRFEGSAQYIATNVFYHVIGSACTPGGSRWPEKVYRQTYGGQITWYGGHYWGSYAYGVGATCTEDGVLQQECIICGKLKQQPDRGSKLGHCFGEYVSDGNASCICDGTKTATCVRCDAQDTVVDVGSKEHKDNIADCFHRFGTGGAVGCGDWHCQLLCFRILVLGGVFHSDYESIRRCRGFLCHLQVYDAPQRHSSAGQRYCYEGLQ